MRRTIALFALLLLTLTAIPPLAAAEADASQGALAFWHTRTKKVRVEAIAAAAHVVGRHGPTTFAYVHRRRCTRSSVRARWRCRSKGFFGEVDTQAFQVDPLLRSATLELPGVSVAWTSASDVPHVDVYRDIHPSWIEVFVDAGNEADATGTIFGTGLGARHLGFAFLGEGAGGYV